MEDADVIVLNTCHIREKAAEKVYSDLGRIRQVKRHRSSERQGHHRRRGGLRGAGGRAPRSLRRAPSRRSGRRPAELSPLGDAASVAVRATGAACGRDGLSRGRQVRRSAGARGPRTATAFLTVQEGCDKFCTFCVVPYTRGAEFSRPVADVEAEARRLRQAGVREITLLGQNVNAYHGAGPDGRPWSLARLDSTGWPASRAWSACATPPAIRAT